MAIVSTQLIHDYAPMPIIFKERLINLSFDFILINVNKVVEHGATSAELLVIIVKAKIY